MKGKSFFSRLFGGGAPTHEVVQPEIITAPKEVAAAAKPTSKLYTAEDVHRDLTAFVLLFLSDIQQEIERKNVPMDVSRELPLLDKLGFNRSKNFQLAKQITNEVEAHNKAFEEKKAALNFMQQAWATFGKDTMVVRYDKFFELLRKYNLVCGSFDRYTGTIPADNLADIERVVNILENNTELVIPFQYITKIDTDNNDISLLLHFNLYPADSTVRKEIFASNGLNNVVIMSQRELAEKEEVIHHRWRRLSALDYTSTDRDRDIRRLRSSCSKVTPASANIFIAAPAQEMSECEIEVFSSSEERRKIEAEERRMREIRTYDPFICSLTPFGVMIFSKWGDEAQDEIIKRYEQLRDAVIGKGGGI